MSRPLPPDQRRPLDQSSVRQESSPYPAVYCHARHGKDVGERVMLYDADGTTLHLGTLTRARVILTQVLDLIAAMEDAAHFLVDAPEHRSEPPPESSGACVPLIRTRPKPNHVNHEPPTA